LGGSTLWEYGVDEHSRDTELKPTDHHLLEGRSTQDRSMYQIGGWGRGFAGNDKRDLRAISGTGTNREPVRACHLFRADLGAIVQETIHAEDLSIRTEEVTERAMTLLTSFELQVVDIPNPFAQTRIVSLIPRHKPKDLLDSCRLRVGRIEGERKREGLFRQRRLMAAAFADVIKETVGAESPAATRKRMSQTALALVASRRFLLALRHNVPSPLRMKQLPQMRDHCGKGKKCSDGRILGHRNTPRQPLETIVCGRLRSKKRNRCRDGRG
jgi:hypothetical protein